MDTQQAARILNIRPDADTASIKFAHRIQASLHHPDRGGDGKKMLDVNLAREHLLALSAAARMAAGAEWDRGAVARAREAAAAMKKAREAEEALKKAAAEAAALAKKQPKTRKAAGWEARHRDLVHEQTVARVARHRAKSPEAYREYMREYMRRKRQSESAGV